MYRKLCSKIKRAFLLLLLLAIFSISFSIVSFADKLKLSVLIYPWVPDYNHISKVVEKEFEKRNPEIDLIISDQNWDYYEPGGLEKKYDIYELDTIFLPDFIANGRLQALDYNRLDKNRLKEAFQFAINGSQFNSTNYGVPHWVCGLFLFYFSHDEKMASASNCDSIVAAIGKRHERNRGLLIDMAGNSTVAELYLDALLDNGLSVKDIISTLKSGDLNDVAFTTMSNIVNLADRGTGRGVLTHKAWPPYHAHEFAHGRGRALVGYSERMHHILKEIMAPTDMTPVVWPESISVNLFNQGSDSGKPLAWVDTFAIASDLSGKKLEAAYAFLNFMMQDDTYIATLLPEGKPPLYLLPAFKSAFANQNLLKSAPLYQKFKVDLESAQNISSIGLPTMLEETGKLLNKKLPNNLYPQN